MMHGHHPFGAPSPPYQPRDRARILGIGVQTIALSAPGFVQVAQSLSQGHAQTPFSPKVSGVARLWWRISSVNTAPPTNCQPRVRLGWSAHDEDARGNLLNPATGGVSDPDSAGQPPELICDAWYGQVEVQGTSFSVSAGFAPDDTAGGNFVVQAIITEGGTGAEQSATFTRYVSVPLGPAPVTVRIPGATVLVNNGAARARTITWYNAVAQDVTLTVSDFSGTAIQLIRTGAIAAPTPYGPVEWPLDPSALSIQVSAGGAAITNGRIVFRYY